MTICDHNTVTQYAKHHANLMLMLTRLQRFVATMPAPDENGCVPASYGYVGSVAQMVDLMDQATEIAEELENG
jgi:hypothetical protein